MRISDWSSDVCSSDLIALDLHGRRQEAVVGRPLFADDVQEAELLVVFERAVDALEQRLELGAEHIAAGAAGAQFLLRVRRQHQQAERLRFTGAGDADGLDFRMRAEPVLDRRRRDILALAGLEQFLDARSEEHTSEIKSLKR